MIHIWHDHVQRSLLRARLGFGVRCIKVVSTGSSNMPMDTTLLPLHSHLLKPQDVRMAQHLQQLHFTQSRDGKAILLIVHEDLLERDHIASTLRTRFRHDTEGAFAQLLVQDLVFRDLRAAAEAPLCRVGHGARRGGHLRHSRQHVHATGRSDRDESGDTDVEGM